MSSTLARPKRAGEEFSRTHHHTADNDASSSFLHGTDGPSSSKKPRFDIRNPSALAPDAIEDDAVLDADEIGRRGQRVKRNAVNIDGYDSDSENEGFNARAEARAKEKESSKKGADADSDDDMFADLEEDFVAEVEERQVADKKKSVRFLADEEIEGQVDDSRAGGTVNVDFRGGGIGKGKQREKAEAESDDSEVDEAMRAAVEKGMDEELGAGGKKKHVPLLDAFNMRAEQEEGRFDEAGNFVRKALDPDAVHDSWLEGVSKKDMRKAREAAEKREAELRKTALERDSVLTSEVLATLIRQLQRGETSLEALARLGKGHKQRPKWQNKNKNKNRDRRKHNGADADADVDMADEDPAETHRKAAIEEITGAADVLLSRGQVEIYDAERELLMRQYSRETGEQWVDPPTTPAVPDQLAAQDADFTTAPLPTATLWEYRWSDARDGGNTHGPYEANMMKSWNEAGYFGEGVEFRRAGGGNGEWTSTAAFS
ncbi:hypothetical protein AJ80_04708 [Polytolypa hystricis UAMH7299]|uniref:GYF domain-containing protein n=1 Tax=Polytolypa hystricis (strain UAMH7299) TaxID=1447883 RepID=A0A2B7Y915_POLH7|nr:hypothetical protein AJ80_04708 [Polytolypa hystricis UAMH7299]